MFNYSRLEEQLKRLLHGLADQSNQQGVSFYYDGGILYPDDVAEILLPSALCIAQHLKANVGMGDIGYQFSIGFPNPVFTLHADPNDRDPPAFYEVAPFIVDVFEHEVKTCKLDVALVFETAARLLDPEYSLGTHNNYVASHFRTAPEYQFWRGIGR